ncbi:nucleoside hydrolase [Paenibacillus sp. WLX1005]|uniref:nucleoside hydrolase n=1 Tax=Paenibacillus sp. WLX1005 TaxID=3243766 RepID=UPI00398430DF
MDTQTNKRTVIMDVDTGIDDALGIMLAAGSGDCDILGITTVNGNVSLEQATINTLKITQLIQHNNIPIYRGANAPLVRKPTFEHAVHGNDGIGGALQDMDVQRSTEAQPAHEYMIEQVMNRPGEITLIMTAPLTNLARALLHQPDLPQYVREVIIMGGAVNEYGNITPTAEYNIYVDPEAAKQVFAAGFQHIVLIPLDVTRRVLLDRNHLAALARTAKPEIAAYVRQSTSDYMQRYEQRNGVQACAMHDPLAVAAALNPKLVSTTAYHVDVETNSDLCDGQTVCDFQNRLGKHPNIQVALNVDHIEFFHYFLSALSRL